MLINGAENQLWLIRDHTTEGDELCWGSKEMFAQGQHTDAVLHPSAQCYVSSWRPTVASVEVPT